MLTVETWLCVFGMKGCGVCVCVISLQKETYSLGFFFGPGLPRGLGMLSEPRPSPLFDPGLGPFVLVFFGVSSVVG
jgi:hypothetical protein